MANPWMKKNPLLSLWLSGANSVAGSVMGHAAAQAKRQTNAAMKTLASEGMKTWMDALSPVAPQPKKRRARPAKR